MNQLISTSGTESSFDLTPKNLVEAMQFCDLLAKSSIVPKDFQGNPGNILVAVQWGMEIGLKPMQAMQNIAVINGRPSIWGDAAIALVRSSSVCEYVYETVENGVALCRVKRKNEDEQIRSFSFEDASKAGLTNKQGPWKQYPERMLQMRARAFALRDVFPDVLKGISIYEEASDFEEIKSSPNASEPKKATSELPPYSNELFDKNFSDWQVAIIGNKVTPENLINKIQSKGSLTESQIDKIKNISKQGGENENA